MEDPDLIATLIPESNLAENAFRRDDNKTRCLPPTRGIDEGPVISSREPTPVYNLPYNDQLLRDYEDTHRIQLTFEKVPPKDPTKGYAFGTDEQRCDVLLASRRKWGISGVHFYITFDMIHEERCLVIRDSSTNGTAVSYSGQAQDEVRHRFTWILNLDKRNGEWEVKVHVRGLAFKVKLASHWTCEAGYDENVGKFLDHSQTAVPPLGGLSIDSHTTEVAPSQSRTPGQRPVYIYEEMLGKGSYGQVNRVIDVSTGMIYAQKTFHEPPWAKDKERRKRQREEWLDQIRREIRIMMEHPHEYMVPIVDFQENSRPFFLMPYLHLGSLNDENFQTPLAEGETVDLLFQGLTVLEHLHSRGVAYRDLKPANILVERRSPLRVQFTDFGLANDQADLKTFCGTEQYVAPEVFTGGRYTTVVDIWSLGVIVLEFVYGLPTQHLYARTHGEAAMRERGLAWCRRLVEYTDDWDSDPLIDLLTSGMLRMEAPRRLSARTCLMRAHELGLFDKPSVSSGDATPTRPTAPTSRERNEEEIPTVVVGALWGVSEEGSNHDGDGQGERSASDRYAVTSTSRQLGVPRFQGGKGAPQLRNGTPEAVSGRSSSHGRSSPGPPSPPEARLMFLGSKRHRSPAVSSPSNPSDESRVKRRPLESRLFDVGASGASKIPPVPDHVGEVMKANAEYLQIMIDGQVVLMRESDCIINATQILKLSILDRNQRGSRLKALKDEYEVQHFPARGTHGRLNAWVSVQCGRELCVELGLAEKLQPLLDQGLDLQQKRCNKGSEKSLAGRKPALRDPANEPEASPFFEVINRSRPVMVRKSDWRINCTHVANQVAERHATVGLRRKIPTSSYDIVRGSVYHQGTYVDFDVGIDWCRKLGLDDLIDRLLQVKRIENEVLEDSLNQSQVSSLVVDSNHSQPVTVDGQLNSEEFPEPENPMGTGDRKTSKSESSEEDNNSSEDNESSADTDITQLYAPRSNESDDEISSRQSNNDTEMNGDQRVEGRTSYYSYGDFEPRNSELKEVMVRLQAPSKTSSRSAPLPRLLSLEDIDAVNFARDREHTDADAAGVSLSGLLNVLDGGVANSGRIVFVSSNAPHKLDKALLRPGRIDREIKFNLPRRRQLYELYLKMYDPRSLSEHADEPAAGLREMAEAFAEKTPESQFSAAEIQGYLQGWKHDAKRAVSGVSQ